MSTTRPRPVDENKAIGAILQFQKVKRHQAEAILLVWHQASQRYRAVYPESGSWNSLLFRLPSFVADELPGHFNPRGRFQRKTTLILPPIGAENECKSTFSASDDSYE